MNSHHKYLLSQIKSLSSLQTPRRDTANYSGSSHPSWEVRIPKIREVVKAWYKANKDISFEELNALLDSLYQGESKEEKKLPGYILDRFSEYRAKIELKQLNIWLGQLVGWEEVDTTCQGVFRHDNLLGRWPEWRAFLVELSKDVNISKRRASIVLLTTPVSKARDERLLKLSFELIDTLKSEKDILITKAISWLLRSMVEKYKEEVVEYLSNNHTTLPKIALRETKKKIETGRK